MVRRASLRVVARIQLANQWARPAAPTATRLPEGLPPPANNSYKRAQRRNTITSTSGTVALHSTGAATTDEILRAEHVSARLPDESTQAESMGPGVGALHPFIRHTTSHNNHTRSCQVRTKRKY